MESEEVTFLEFRMTCVESGVPRHIMQCAADHAVTDDDVLLQICYGFTEEICVCRYVCIYRQTY